MGGNCFPPQTTTECHTCVTRNGSRNLDDGVGERFNSLRERCWQLSVDEKAQSCAPQDGMIVLASGEFQNCDVFGFEVGIVGEIPRGNSNPPPAATDCQSFVSRLASFRNSRSRDARPSWLDDYECAGDPIAKFCSEIDESLTERASHPCWEPNQDNSSGLASTRVREQTEVFVFSQKVPRASERANAKTTLSSTPGLISAIAMMSWPALRSALTTMKSQLSSARNRTG